MAIRHDICGVGLYGNNSLKTWHVQWVCTKCTQCIHRFLSYCFWYCV